MVNDEQNKRERTNHDHCKMDTEKMNERDQFCIEIRETNGGKHHSQRTWTEEDPINTTI